MLIGRAILPLALLVIAVFATPLTVSADVLAPQSGSDDPIAYQSGVPEGLYPHDKRTGVAAIDAVIQAVVTQDADALAALIAFSPSACTTETGLGGPAKCTDGEAEGTVVQALPIGRCGAGSMERADSDLGPLFENFVGSGVWLSSAWNVGSEDGFPTMEEAGVAGQYRVMFAASTSDTFRRVATLDASGNVVGLSFGCGTPAATYEGAAGFILPPANSDVTPVPPATGTGVQEAQPRTNSYLVIASLAVMVVVAGAAGVAVIRRRVQE